VYIGGNKGETMKKRIELEKSEDGSVAVISGVTIPEFNKESGFIITNTGEYIKDSLDIYIRVENGFTNKNFPYRLRVVISDEKELECQIREAYNTLRRMCSTLIGREDFITGDSTTYEEFESDYIERFQERETA
jgi:hypothetical protein